MSAHRDLLLAADTSKMITALVAAVAQLDFDHDHWIVLHESAQHELESLTRLAVRSSSPESSLTAPAVQCSIQELALRLELLEEFIAQLPTKSINALP